MSEPAAERLIEECKEVGLGLTFLPQHFGLLGPGIELNRLAELPVLDFRFSDPPRSTLAMKRASTSSSRRLLLALLSPLLLVIAIAILLDSGRPVLFRQRRAGKEGEPFTDAQVPHHGRRRRGAARRAGRPATASTSPSSRSADDPRVTRVGRFLRRTSLDELPQFAQRPRARCRWSGRGPRRRRSSPSTTSASAAGSRSSRG